MATFRDWLRGQEDRDDQVGWFATFWRDLPDTPRLSSPSSIHKHLESRDLFATTPGLSEAVEAVWAEYRAGRQLDAVKAAESILGPQGGTSAALAPARAAMDGPTPVMDRLDKIQLMLEMVVAHLGLAVPDGLPPIEWPRLYGLADMAAAEAGA